MNKYRDVGEKSCKKCNECLMTNEVSFVNICISRFVRIRVQDVSDKTNETFDICATYSFLQHMIFFQQFFLRLNHELFI